MDCIVIDDEKMARIIIKTFCDETKDINVVEEFSNSMDAFKFLHSNKVDLIFLDIHMPGFSGLDFIKTLKDPPKVIFTTSDSKFAIEAFEYNFIVDYLLKPVSAERFTKAIEKAQKLIYLENLDSSEKPTSNSNQEEEEEHKNDFYVNIDRRLVKIDLPSICYVQAKGDYIYVKTDANEYEVHASLKKIEQKLPSSLFLKVHRSYIINVKKIIDIEDNSVLINRDVIPVSRSNRPDLMKRLDLL
ncbi:LytTR family two component transcriptional regulator [Tenacibaculum skagerrakense]|uniref:LytTR family two component transcriptional regulator n=1 Tax=Tenacibaculum skagerrakense TaxID=186571 RepID=A0A4R2NPE2_9FLAO|nr:LytTR family DNA-binding domain-containing protein [Tenacibaculum skagerrakense]TCP23291.1 LytTR family two component transcriptional regulator [Tenacibaculum skagerrakense]